MMKKIISLLVMLLLTIALSACNQVGNEKEQQNQETEVDQELEGNNSATEGEVTYSTKNVTRLDAKDVVNAAIQVSRTIWPASQDDNKPKTIILAPTQNWQLGLASTDLIHHPTNGPVLFYENEQIPEDTLQEINRLEPLGTDKGIEILIMGDPPQKVLDQLKDYSVEQLKGNDPAEFAARIDEFYADEAGDLPESVIIVSSEEEAKLYSLIAANWIAHMPEPVLFVTNLEIPQATKEALEKRAKKANLYILGPESIISKNVEASLSEFGTVTRIKGETPVDASLEFAQFKDEISGFGWGINEPGHGFLFTSTENADYAVAGAPFAHLGKHAPLIWLENGELTDKAHDMLLELQPKFEDDPTVGPYNHGFILGSGDAVSMKTQGVIDQMLEIISGDGGGHVGH